MSLRLLKLLTKPSYIPYQPYKRSLRHHPFWSSAIPGRLCDRCRSFWPTDQLCPAATAIGWTIRTDVLLVTISQCRRARLRHYPQGMFSPRVGRPVIVTTLERFKISIPTDHDTLKGMLNLTHTSWKHIRWLSRLPELGYDVILRSNAKNQAVDALRRISTPSVHTLPLNHSFSILLIVKPPPLTSEDIKDQGKFEIPCLAEHASSDTCPALLAGSNWICAAHQYRRYPPAQKSRVSRGASKRRVLSPSFNYCQNSAIL